MFLGDNGCGKTALYEGRCRSKSVTTVGAFVKRVSRSENPQHEIVVWDVGPTHYVQSPGCRVQYNVAVVVFDMRNGPASASAWLCAACEARAVIVLCANKLDLCTPAQVRRCRDVVEKLRCGLPPLVYVQTSARTGEGVAELYEAIFDAQHALPRALPEAECCSCRTM